MIAAVVFLLLLLATVAWVALPLVPAMRELLHPTDVEPLTMVGRDNADISRFARHFREYVEANLRRLPSEATGDYFGKLPDGTPFVRVARITEILERGALPDGSHDRLVVLDHPVTLRGGEQFRLEIWAREAFTGGPRAVYRAVLGERSIRLGEGSTVLRWIHGRGRLEVLDGCTLFGRTSSEEEIRLGREVAFERMGAPVIAVGSPPPPAGAPAARELVPVEIPEASRRLGDLVRVDRDFALPPHGLFVGNLVVGGELRLAPGARIRGNVKAHGEIHLDRGAVVEGSLVSTRSIRLGPATWAKGPVIAEDDIALEEGAAIATPNTPSTVSGRTVALGPETTVCGHIVAQAGAHS
jgi:hypothetical protein